MPELLRKLRRGLSKPPRYIAERALREVQSRCERYAGPWRAQRLSAKGLALQAGFTSSDEWWVALASRPYPAHVATVRPDELERLCPGEHSRIMAAAHRATARQVDLLGSGPVYLGEDINWHCDYKTGHQWPPGYCRGIDYNNPGRPSDVKFPWELSRMQWMIPLGQAYLLTGDERYAETVKDLLEHWMRSNGYASSVNWSCTMEVALRILSWTWFFHVFKHSAAWADRPFRERFLRCLYLHGDYTARHLEKSDVNGNHYTADAAGLVFAGLFFGKLPDAERWLQLGWQILCEELPRQVYEDGVDFEASVPYHRLVEELFFLPALYRLTAGHDVPKGYRDRLVAMAQFTAAYSRDDGSVPLWGDADDARALPFGGQYINDHRYLLGLIGTQFEAEDLVRAFSGPRDEVLWLLGPSTAAALAVRREGTHAQSSVQFPHGGFFVLRNAADHVFVDCGPLGLAGRGGHGHNDLLSFEAVLDGAHLVTDCGAYLYTADYAERNLFRSTGYHNTPQVDGEEINRFVAPDYLWTLHNDAENVLRECTFRPDVDRLVISHTGYSRLQAAVVPVRTISLEHTSHRLTITDHFV
jgi:uncharacterized heparinase superfamily protein